MRAAGGRGDVHAGGGISQRKCERALVENQPSCVGCSFAEGSTSGWTAGCEQGAAVLARHQHGVCTAAVRQRRHQRLHSLLTLTLNPRPTRNCFVATQQYCSKVHVVITCSAGLVLQADVAQSEDKNFLALSQAPLPSPSNPSPSPSSRHAFFAPPQALEKASLAPAIPAVKAGALTSFSAKVPHRPLISLPSRRHLLHCLLTLCSCWPRRSPRQNSVSHRTKRHIQQTDSRSLKAS